MSRYTREIHTLGTEGGAIDARRSMLQKRHRLLRQAQSIMFDGSKEAKQQHRVVWCHRHVRTEGAMPVFRQLDGSRSRLGSVKTCGSVWACPVCAAKVAEQRRQELHHAMVKHTAAGGHAYLLTFTFPHYKGEALAQLMPAFDKARQQFQNSKGWKKVMGKDGTAGRVGSVTSLEVTYGDGNGWHPHLHMLVFCNPGAFREGEADDQGRLHSAAIDYFRGAWVSKLERNGLVDSQNRNSARQYGLDVRGGEKAAEYIAKWGHDEKWGMSSELTSSHAKVGKRAQWGANDHYTPFQLLAMADAGDMHALCAFREFVNAFDGKRMLTWSPGLKEHFGVAELTDEDAAAEQVLGLNDEHQVGEIVQQQLQALTKWGRLGDFLAFIAEQGHRPDSQQLIDDWIANCAGGRRRRGNILVDALVVPEHGNRYFFKPVEIEA